MQNVEEMTGEQALINERIEIHRQVYQEKDEEERKVLLFL